MGDPYPEAQAQEWLDQLLETARLNVEQIETARSGWWNAGEALREIAEQLTGGSTPSSTRKAAWIGSASDAATEAFDALAQEFLRHATAMQDLSQALARGCEDVKQISEIVTLQIGTKLKPKPKGGLFGTGIGPSLGPDVVEFVDDVADGVGAVAKNPTAIINKGALLGGPVAPLAALAIAGDNAERQELSREDQFRLIESTWKYFDDAATAHGEAVVASCSELDATYASFDSAGDAVTFENNPSPGLTHSELSPSTGRGRFGSSSAGDPRLSPFASPDRGHSTIGDSVPSFDQGVTVDGGVVGSRGGSSALDLAPDGSTPYAPSGGEGRGGLSGGGAAAGAGASLAGVGGGLAGALGGAKAAAAGGLGAAPGVLGGSAGAAGAKGNAMSMLGQGMGGGAGGGGDKKGGGKRYGDGPELGPRDRRRGVKHAVLGAGSRGGGNGGGDGGGDTTEPESDDPFLDGG